MLAVTIDMDGPAEYAAIHGLPTPACDPRLMYGGPLERFARLCDRIGARGTVFAVGRDLDTDAAERVRALAADGYEIASHSAGHDYRLSLGSRAAIDDDLQRSRAIHERVLGAAPLGFRAPGHHLSSTLLDALESAGFVYSSSALPSPPYYAAKAAVLAGYRLLGRTSTAMLGSPRMAVAPRAPYRPGCDPYRPGERSLLELPVTVATRARLPVTGASLVLAPAPVRDLMVRAVARAPLIVLNLHAMDLTDANVDGLPAPLAERQPELRVAVAERCRILGGVLEELADEHTPVTCAELAARV